MIRRSGDPVIGKPNAGGCEDAAIPRPAPAARYAYYRRCQLFLRNGEQCKAPAMKGERICHQHARQADNVRRRERQRRAFFSRPGVGFESFSAIQRTIGELVNAVLAGVMDRKVAGRIVLEIQIAIRLQKVAAGLQRRIARTKRAVSHRAQGDGHTRWLESRSHRLTRILAAGCSSSSKREQEATSGRAYEKQEI